MNKEAYLITNIEEYGKLIAFCIKKIFAFFGHIGTSEKKVTDVSLLIGKRKSVSILPGFITKTMVMR